LSFPAKLKVLFVCSRNQWRSPTGERIWRNHSRVDARSGGTADSARHQVTESDVDWADVVTAMEHKHKARLVPAFPSEMASKSVHMLDIPDDDRFMDPELVDLLRQPVAEILGLENY
jgi:predicted protein tyrosine phosphatase